MPLPFLKFFVSVDEKNGCRTSNNQIALNSLPQGLNVHKVDGQPPQLDPRPQPRPASHVPVHLGESMPKAALDHGLRPHLRNRAMRTTRSLARHMPSTKTTLCFIADPPIALIVLSAILGILLY